MAWLQVAGHFHRGDAHHPLADPLVLDAADQQLAHFAAD
jgi:hypothetical protein